MAVLGAQLVFSMIMACFLERITRYVSFGRWLLTHRLVRYLYPTDEDLKSLVSSGSSSKGKNKRERDFRKFNGYGNNRHVKDAFTVPKNLPLMLEMCEVDDGDVIHLKYYPELQWIMDFSLTAFIVYLITEGYYTLPTSVSGLTDGEMNISMIWCVLAVWFVFKLLCSLTSLYFHGDDTGERSVCLTSAFTSLLLAMIVLIVDESILEFGLNDAYTSFNRTAVEFLRTEGITSEGPASKFSVKLIFAVLSSILGSLLIFPSIRMTRMHMDALTYCSDYKFYRLLLYMNYLLPLLALLTWVKPVSRDVVTASPTLSSILNEGMFDSCRLWLLMFLVALRFLLTSFHLQAYLNTAHTQIEIMKKESGRISNVELQRKIARIFQYLCVITLQYLLPALLILFLTCCLKYLGCHSWLGDGTSSGCSQSNFLTVTPSSGSSGDDDSISVAAQRFNFTLQSLRSVFNATVFRGMLNYLIWWICSVCFIGQLFGFMIVKTHTSI